MTSQAPSYVKHLTASSRFDFWILATQIADWCAFQDRCLPPLGQAHGRVSLFRRFLHLGEEFNCLQRRLLRDERDGNLLVYLAPRAGFERATQRLTGGA